MSNTINTNVPPTASNVPGTGDVGPSGERLLAKLDQQTAKTDRDSFNSLKLSSKDNPFSTEGRKSTKAEDPSKSATAANKPEEKPKNKCQKILGVFEKLSPIHWIAKGADKVIGKKTFEGALDKISPANWAAKGVDKIADTSKPKQVQQG